MSATRRLPSLLCLALLLLGSLPPLTAHGYSPLPPTSSASFSLSLRERVGVREQSGIPFRASTPLYFPFVSGPSLRRANLPYFPEADLTAARFSEMAVFWFGQVSPASNYADVRLAFNDDALWVYLAVIDRRLWYDPTPSPADLTNWDAASLYLDLAPTAPFTPQATSYQFVAQFTPFPAAADRLAYQRAYQGQSGIWQPVDLPFSTGSGWRGNAANDNLDDKGWALTFVIPFSSLGITRPPADASQTWRLALQLHDRDLSGGALTPAPAWPEWLNPAQPASWGQARFGLPAYTPPALTPAGTITVRHRLDGAVVADASVGGYTVCGGGLDYWSEWGDTPEAYYNAEHSDYNIQNQSDISDYPCFSKVYLRFPLAALPAGAQLLSAQLTLHQFGGSGAPGTAESSLIQVLSLRPGWDDLSLTWNNAPLAEENVARAWVDPLASMPAWPGIPREWNVSYAVAQALADEQPYLTLALYSADSAYHSGKYFVSSDTGDWNAAGRPTLTITWGLP